MTRRAVELLILLFVASCGSELPSEASKGSSAPAAYEVSDSGPLGQIIAVIVKDGFHLDLKDIDALWLLCEGFSTPVPDAVEGKRVFHFDFGAPDPFHGQTTWSDKPVVFQLISEGGDEDRLVINALKRSAGSYLHRELEVTRTAGTWQITKTISSGRAIR